MRVAYCILAFAFSSLLMSCTSIDKNAALALAKAGQDATRAVSDQSIGAQNTIGVLPQWWAVGQALECSRVPVGESRDACIGNAEQTANSDASDKSLDKLSLVMKKRTRAALELMRAYSGFGDLINYDASADAQNALNSAFSSINSFLSAVGTLTGTQAGLKPLGATAEGIAAKGVGLLASQRQNKQILAASVELHKAVDAFSSGLRAEKNKALTESLLTLLADQKGALYLRLIESGVIEPKDVLVPLVMSLGQGIPIAQTMPKKNNDAISKAAALSFKAQAKIQTGAVIVSYESALSALSDLSEQHENLERGAPIELSDITANVQKVAEAIQSLNGGNSNDK